jgi:hypothetical protein
VRAVRSLHGVRVVSAQAAADALLAAAQVPGGFVVDFAGGMWRVRSPYSATVCGHGTTLDAAVLAYAASRAFEDSWRAALDAEHAGLSVTAPAESGTQVVE